MKTNKKEYFLRAKRKAYQDINQSGSTGEVVTTVETAPNLPGEVVKKAVSVKKTVISQAAKDSEVATVSTQDAGQPAEQAEVVETAAN